MPAKRARPSGPPVAGENGNWQCRQCGNVNFATRDVCNRCGAMKEDDASGELEELDSFEAGVEEVRPVRASKAPVAGENGNWTCDHCGNVNFGSRVVCNKCQAPRPQRAPPPPPAYAPAYVPPPHFPSQAPSQKGGAPRAGVDGNWACPQCQNVNFASRTVCNRCGWAKPANQPPARGKGGAPIAGVDGNWACPSCGNVNFRGRTECNRCHEPKPEELMSDEALAEQLLTPADDEPLPKRARAY